MNKAQIGLTTNQASEKLSQFGKNKLKDTQKVSVFRQLLNQFLNPLIIVLIIISLISLVLNETVEAIVISAVLVMNCLVGFFQERKAEHAVDSIRKLISLKSKVYRDNAIQIIEAEDIVPGDVVVVEAGDKVPADGTLIEYKNLQINEAQLTGESYPVQKTEKENKAFMSSIVTNGRGLLLVEKTGMETEIGKITGLISKKGSDKTPLEIKFKILTRRIIVMVFIASLTLFITGLLQGYSFIEIFKASVSMGVSSIPEGLPVVVTITLAIGVYRMSKQNSIIKNLPSASTLAGVDVICTDKTGTITEGKIVLQDTYLFKGNRLVKNYKDNHFLKLCALCNDASIALHESGDLLDIALLKHIQEHGLNLEEINQHHKRVDDIPFDSDYKYHVTLNTFSENENIIIVKGAFDVLVEKCSFKDESDRIHIKETTNSLAEQGLRVILLASKYTTNTKVSHNDVNDLDINGLLVFIDPLRKDVHEAIQKCIQSGIKTVMITGDHVATAKYIAMQAGITNEDGLAIDASEFREKSDAELIELLDKITVVARATPMDKVRLVDCFNQIGKTVAMTGDGVNDSPALVKADIGIAMGENGTDAAREAADMVLLDNKFSTIVHGIEEARVVYENLKKVVTYLFSTSLGEILTIFLSIVLGLPLPLIAVQILWLNLITDGFLVCAVALDEKENNIMSFKPERYKRNILNNLMLSRIFYLGLIMSVGSVLLFQVILKNHSLQYAQTSILIVMAMFQWFNAFNARSEEESIFKIGFFSNKYVTVAVLLEALLLVFAVYTPIMQKVLHTVPVELDVWIYSTIAALTIIAFEEIRKAYVKSLNARPGKRR
jgi:P-type Ca2+ transporter type 2C